MLNVGSRKRGRTNLPGRSESDKRISTKGLELQTNPKSNASGVPRDDASAKASRGFASNKGSIQAMREIRIPNEYFGTRREWDWSCETTPGNAVGGASNPCVSRRRAQNKHPVGSNPKRILRNAEGVGFEPTEPLTGLNSFQDYRLRPLGHPSRPAGYRPPNHSRTPSFEPAPDEGADTQASRLIDSINGSIQISRHPDDVPRLWDGSCEATSEQRRRRCFEPRPSQRRGHKKASRGSNPTTKCMITRRGWDSNPRNRSHGSRHFECRALDRTMRPLRGCIRGPGL